MGTVRLVKFLALVVKNPPSVNFAHLPHAVWESENNALAYELHRPH